jgi:cytochrome d ubiquinol oxidase subunit I
MQFDPTLLARIQFAANITFHILFPTITIALGWFLLFFKKRYNATKDYKWMEVYFFWTKIFALCFAIGVVTGITMSFQFGTNWPGFMTTVGNIAGPLLAYEVLTAFFLEATFLGIMLFGFRRVSTKLHDLATLFVAGGTTLSAFWILALNSWMQTPTGYEMIDGKAFPTSWLSIIFNPSFPYRLIHMLLASALTASFLIAGISAYRWLRHDRTPAVMAALKSGIIAATILIPVQIAVGDLHGLNTLKYQPQKIAAMEALWETEEGAPFVLFALPNEGKRTNDFAITIPKAASLVLTHEAEGKIQGLNEFKGNHPPVGAMFWSFRIMLLVGTMMLLTSWAAAYHLKKHQNINEPLAKLLVVMTFSDGLQPFPVGTSLKSVVSLGWYGVC